MDKFRAKILLEQKRDQLHLESFMRHDNIQKSQPEDINPFDKFEEDIQKGKPAAIGETRVWNGKKVKKIAEGKWVEISSEGKSRKEHEFESNKANVEEHSSNASKKDIETGRLKRIEERHKEQASKLSDKEYTDEEIENSNADNKREELYELGKMIIDKSPYTASELREDYEHDKINTKLDNKSYIKGWLSARGLSNGHLVFPYLQFLSDMHNSGNEKFKKKK